MCVASGCDNTTKTHSTTPNQHAIELGGNYNPVSSADLIGCSSSQRTGGIKHNFKWTFAANTFSLVGDNIPQDLVVALTGNKTQTTGIEGTWEIKGEKIHLSPTSDNDKDPQSVALPIRNTGVIRVITPDAQYVFIKNQR